MNLAMSQGNFFVKMKNGRILRNARSFIKLTILYPKAVTIYINTSLLPNSFRKVDFSLVLNLNICFAQKIKTSEILSTPTAVLKSQEYDN